MTQRSDLHDQEGHQIKDRSADASYFIITPQIVWAKCKDPYDLALWTVIKMVSGDEGECWLGTRRLAALAMMSTGQVSRSRQRLLAAGLLLGELRADPDCGQVWHLTIPNLWQENLAWREAHRSLGERLGYKEQQRSPDEQGCSQEEQGCSWGETKNIQPKNNQEEEPLSPEPAAPEPAVTDTLAKARERDRRQREAWSRMHAAQEPDDEPQTGWQVPESPEQREFLEATGARRFETGQKRQVELIEALMDTAMVMNDQTWTTLESYLARAPAGAGLDLARLPCLPQLWWDDRLEQARQHRWSRKGLLKALLNREKLMEFVRRQVRQMQKGGQQTHDRRPEPGNPDLSIDDPSALVA